MKAIIMAGGQGSRLRPLTCNCPKPMLPVANKPMMAHIVDLLKKHQISDIGVTLQYLPDTISDYFGNGTEFGVSMRYFIEEVPLGTAGSVKNAQDFLDETFIVISGDALTDFDLTEAINFHKQNRAVATLVLTRVASPLEYGVVITDPVHRVQQFLEKPSWGEVFSDTVNTGIYILEPEVLDYFEMGQKFDFSKDLFPILLREQQPMFGVTLDGYWCDIGNLNQYLQAHRDVLEKKVQVAIAGEEMSPNIFVGENVYIDPTAIIDGPVLIGDGCHIGSQVRIDPYTVLGKGCILEPQASLKRSLVFDGVYLGPRASLRGTVLGNGVSVYANAAIYEGSVVGGHSTIEERGVIKPDVKLWPNKLVEAGATVSRNIIWGTGKTKNIFGNEGISGLVNVEINPEFATRIGSALGSTLGSGTTMLLSSDSYQACDMIKNSLAVGLQSTGIAVKDIGIAVTPVHRYTVSSAQCQAGVHVKICPWHSGKITMVFTNERGGNISPAEERKIENKLTQDDYNRIDVENIMPIQHLTGATEAYLANLVKGSQFGQLRNASYKIIMAYDNNNLTRYLTPIARAANLNVETIAPTEKQWLTWTNYQEMLPDLGQQVVQQGANAGIIIDPNGDNFILLDEQGQPIQDDMLTALLVLILLKERGGPVVVPVTAPMAIEDMARQYNSKVVRTKTAVQDFLEQLIQQESKQNYAVSQSLLNLDALTAFVKILAYCAKEGVKISDLVAEIPKFFVHQQQVKVPWEVKGKVIRQLIEESPGKKELLDGIKVFHQDGWTLVLPDVEEPLCRVYSEGTSMEIAEELTAMYIDKINKISGA